MHFDFLINKYHNIRSNERFQHDTLRKYFCKPSDPVIRATQEVKGIANCWGDDLLWWGRKAYRSHGQYYWSVSSSAMWHVRVNIGCPLLDKEETGPCRLVEWTVCSWYSRSNMFLQAAEDDDITETVQRATAYSVGGYLLMWIYFSFLRAFNFATAAPKVVNMYVMHTQ